MGYVNGVMNVRDCYIGNLIVKQFWMGNLLFTDAFPKDKRFFRTKAVSRH
jgi:hypothetical protein